MIALYVLTYLFIGLAFYATLVYLDYKDLVAIGILEDKDGIWTMLLFSIFLWPLLVVLLVFAFILFEITMKLKAKKNAKLKEKQ